MAMKIITMKLTNLDSMPLNHYLISERRRRRRRNKGLKMMIKGNDQLKFVMTKSFFYQTVIECQNQCERILYDHFQRM